MLAGLLCLVRPIARIGMPTRKRAGIVFGCGLAAFVTAFNTPYTYVPPVPAAKSKPASDADQTDQDPKPSTPAQLAAPPPPPPDHLYTSIDGDEYLYSAGISDDARDAGQVAGQFIAFRFRGVKNGKITLTGEGATLRCDEVCTVITMIDQFGNKQHIEYNPSSVAGAAFTDAMNGLLVEHPSRKNEAVNK